MSEQEQAAIVDPRGNPPMKLEPGCPCPKCGAPGSKVMPAFGGGVRCWGCGYQEGIDGH